MSWGSQSKREVPETLLGVCWNVGADSLTWRHGNSCSTLQATPVSVGGRRRRRVKQRLMREREEE